MKPKIYTTTQIGKIYDISARDLNRMLINERVIRKTPGGYVLQTHHLKKGFEVINEYSFVRSQGQPDYSTTLKWTEAGKSFIQNIIESLGFSLIGEADDENERTMERHQRV